MNGKPWSKREIWELFGASEHMSQADAAAALGRGVTAVSSKASTIGLRWRSGFVSLTSIAKKVGCSGTTVRTACNTLGLPKYGKGNATRYLIDVAAEEALISYLKRRLKQHRQQQEAGKWRLQKKKSNSGS